MGNYTISQIFENRRRGRLARNFANKCSENSRSQIFFRTHIFRKLTLGAPTNFWTDKSLHASGAFRFHGTRRTVQVLVWTLVNSTAISNRICTVPCKRVAQVKNSSVQKFVPDPCKRYVSFRSIFNRVFTTRRRRQRKCHLKSEFALLIFIAIIPTRWRCKMQANSPLSWFLWNHVRVQKDGKKILSSLDNFLRQTWNQAFSRRSRPVTANVEVVVLLINPLSPNSDQDQFSPSNIHTLSRDKLWELIKWSPERKCPDLSSNSLN